MLIADTNAKLQSLVDKLDVECNRMGLKINIGKTEVMGIPKSKGQLRVVVNIGGQTVKKVSSFRYLGSLVSEDGKCDAEIRSRIAMGKARFGQMRRILTSMSLSSEVRLRLLKSYIWSGMLYGCESWTIIKEMRRRLEAAEVWFIQKNAENPMDGKDNKPGCDTDRRHKKRTNNCHKKKTARVPWACVETEWPRK